MNKLFVALCGAALLLAAASVRAADPTPAQITGKTVTYKAGDTTLKGYLVYDAARAGKRPAVLVVPEWWGQDEYARKRATMLAELGYVALAVDMYGDGKVLATPAEAGQQAGAIGKDSALAKARFQAALELVQQQPNVDPARVGAVGYCFGGGIVLNMARAGLPLPVVVCFHGSLKPADKPAAIGTIKSQVVAVYNGADDKFVPAEDIAAFKQEMSDAKVDLQFHSMAGSLHAFTNPAADDLAKKFNLPIAYNAAADKTSWADLQQVLATALKP